ncbi:nuclease-related domain-containing protein [Jeotgalibacillus salarius]|uniref:nuclease-related domain-containing protein n=1 Tax=Jeotgalibacillus salarius TaxID=546023 RepID=UPI00141A7152|nr:nuclease-related domain-containing protein [Jeotgalibacillus salarius]
MIFHERKPSIRAHAYELLSRHLPENLPAKTSLLKEASIIRAGEFGEKLIDQLLLPFGSDEFLIGLNLTFPFDGETIQIDHLVLTPSFALTIETKHIKGHVKLDLENEQMYRHEPDGSIFTSTHPPLQAERHRKGLLQIFNKMNVDLPVYSLIPFTHSTVHLEAVGSYTVLPQEICRSGRFTMKLRELCESGLPQKISPLALPQIADTLKTYTVNEKIYHTLDRFNISKSQLIPGVWCHFCSELSCIWTGRRFRCQLCREPNDETYQDTLFVYLTFVSESIANKQARIMLNLTRPGTARILMLKAGLEPFHKTSKRFYRIRKSIRAN